MLNVAVFVSGRGSNLKSLYKNASKEKISVCAVISDKLDCLALEFAKTNGIPVFFVSNKHEKDFISFGELTDKLKELSVNLIVLAGFLKKIPDDFVDSFENMIINIHPALLPSFGGKGMYGSNVHNAVYSSSAQVSGATVHFVNKIYDDGLIISQKAVDITNVKNAEEIAERVIKVEHELLPWVVEKFADNKIKIDNKRVILLD